MARCARDDPFYFELVKPELADLTPQQMTTFKRTVARGIGPFLLNCIDEVKGEPTGAPESNGADQGDTI